MVTAEEEGSDKREPAKKEWYRPMLRKLPIEATAGPELGNEGINGKKNGSSGNLS
jgi:hypothetical protein